MDDSLVNKPVQAAGGEPIRTIRAVLHPEGEAPSSHPPHYVVLAPAAGREDSSAASVYLLETVIREVDEDSVIYVLSQEQVKVQGRTDPPDGVNHVRSS